MKKRLITITHRVKRTTVGESRPTLVRIIDHDGKSIDLELETEQNELDFILGRLPLRMRDAGARDRTTDFAEHLAKFEEYDPEKHAIVPEHHKLVKGKKTFVMTKVPEGSIGLQKGDVVLMTLGGSGDYLACAISVQAEKVGAEIFRTPPRRIKEKRETLSVLETDNVMDDLGILCQIYIDSEGQKFYPVTARERSMIQARESYRARQNTQRDRKACAQRVLQLAIGEIFVGSNGLFPQGSIEKQFDEREANDDILGMIRAREKRLEVQIAAALENLPVYTKVFKPIEGVGPIIAAGIITAIGNIHLFARSGGNLGHRAGGLKKFCGVAPEGGHLARKTAGKSLGYNPDVRQALYQFGDQLVRRPGSFWGQKLAENKAEYQRQHPHPIVVVKDGPFMGEYILDSQELLQHARKGKKGGYEIFLGNEGQEAVGWWKVSGKQKYFKGHLHKMAIWKTLTQFVEYLYDEWTKLEGIVTEGEEKTDAAA